MAPTGQNASKKVKQTASEDKEKASKQTTTPAGPKENPIFIVAYVVALLSVAAFSSPVSQLNLFPVYGSIGASLHHQNAISFTVILSFIIKVTLKNKGIASGAEKWIAPWSYYVLPLQWLLFQQSSKLGPVYGPLITEGLTFYPVLLLTCVTVFLKLDELRYGSATPAVLSYGAYTALEKAATRLIPEILGKSDFFSRSGLQLLTATVSAAITRSSLLTFAVPAVLHTLFSNPHYYGPGPMKILNSTLANDGYIILDRADSNTGYISVVENIKDEFRVLRADHSILGGEWLLTEERKKAGYEEDETIYGVFTMLENVRIIKQAEYTPDDEKDALIIGLGAGTAPKAFINHGLNVSIIELDPKVYEFTTKYFNFPEEHNIILEDAVAWAGKYAKDNPESFDYILHDVFTGGAEPTALFTLEFLQDLSRLLKEDGAIAINYAGDIQKPPTKIVLNTIRKVFPTCRAYRDTGPYVEETFLNMVVYCTKLNTPIEWRTPTNADYLGSMARREFMPPDEGYELDLPAVIADKKYHPWDILTRSNETILEEYRIQSGLRHWSIMRTVMPDGVWENW